MQKTLYLFFTCCITFSLSAQSDCTLGSSYIELDINNVRAGLRSSGSLWWDGFDGAYFVPNNEAGETQVSAMFAGGLWLGGYDANGSLRLAAQRYGSTFSQNTDFFPGPINQLTGSTEEDGCTNWDTHFKIEKLEIDQHLLDYSDNNIIDFPIVNILVWPGRDNPHFSANKGFDLPAGQDLAPFIDVNNDNIYNPLEGDYPDIQADQAIWWVFNDIAHTHSESDGLPLKVEVQAIAYAYSSTEPAINNTTFYDFKIINRGGFPITDFHSALWLDVDLGCYTDDYFGMDTINDMSFHYNIDEVDGDVGDQCGPIETYGENIPMLGVKLLDDSANLGVTNFSYFLNPGVGAPDPTLWTPQEPEEFMNYLTGKWRDGSPLTFGGNGYGGTEETSFAFSGNPDNSTEWSMFSENSNPDYDNKTVMSTGGITLNPEDSFTLSYGVIFVPDVAHPGPSLDKLREAADIVQNFDYQVSTSTKQVVQKLDFSIYPNPTSNNFTISFSNDKEIESIQITDISGREIFQIKEVKNNFHSINSLAFQAGVYFVKIETTKGKFGIKKLIVK